MSGEMISNFSLFLGVFAWLLSVVAAGFYRTKHSILTVGLTTSLLTLNFFMWLSIR